MSAAEVTPTILQQIDQSTRAVVGSEDFLKRLATEIAFQTRQMTPYPVMLKVEELNELNVIARPGPVSTNVGDQLLILTKVPVQGPPVHVVCAVRKPLPVDPDQPTLENAPVSRDFDVTVYLDNIDITQRKFTQLSPAMDRELRRQLASLDGEGGFYYMSVIGVKHPE